MEDWWRYLGAVLLKWILKRRYERSILEISQMSCCKSAFGLYLLNTSTKTKFKIELFAENLNNLLLFSRHCWNWWKISFKMNFRIDFHWLSKYVLDIEHGALLPCANSSSWQTSMGVYTGVSLHLPNNAGSNIHVMLTEKRLTNVCIEPEALCI